MEDNTLFLFFMTIFMLIPWDDLTSINKEVVVVVNFLAKDYLTLYIKTITFKAELDIWGIPYKNEQFYLDLINSFLIDFKEMTILPYESDSNKDINKYYQILLIFSEVNL